jgi:hypothetical protein
MYPTLRIEHQDEREAKLGDLDPDARAVIAFLERISSGAESGAIESDPIVAGVDSYGVVTTTLATSYGEIFLQAGDGWDRVLWTQPPEPPLEWPWDARAPTILAALLRGELTERRTLVRGRLALREAVVREASGEETVVTLRRTPAGLPPLLGLLRASGLVRTVERRVSAFA